MIVAVQNFLAFRAPSVRETENQLLCNFLHRTKKSFRGGQKAFLHLSGGIKGKSLILSLSSQWDLVFCCCWIPLNSLLCQRRHREGAFLQHASQRSSWNWKPQNNSLIMRLSGRLSCFQMKEGQCGLLYQWKDEKDPSFYHICYKTTSNTKSIIMSPIIRISSDRPQSRQINLIKDGIKVHRASTRSS